ncbi:GNAT family N-acetyltransferase [Paenibacillus sp. strain BS8-2]
MKEGTEFPLRIVLKESNEIIGTITLRVDKLNNRGELGYWMGRDFWGHGYATEAARRMIESGFVELGLNRIWATAITRNKASVRVLEKAGLRKEGTLKQNRLLADTYEDVDVYGLVKSDYGRF